MSEDKASNWFMVELSTAERNVEMARLHFDDSERKLNEARAHLNVIKKEIENELQLSRTRKTQLDEALEQLLNLKRLSS